MKNIWLKLNKRNHLLDTDAWYIDFANRLLPLVRQSGLFIETPGTASDNYTSTTEAAAKLSLYLRDAVAQQGGWKSFSDMYHYIYKEYLPFYPATDDYVSDEINPDDVKLLLWMFKSRPATRRCPMYSVFNPYHPDLLRAAQAIYDAMDEAFEQAPIAPVASPDNWVMERESMIAPSTPLPEALPGMKISPYAARCLSHSGGHPLLFFATYPDLCTFLTEVLGWQGEAGSLLPELSAKREFVIYANAKGMLIAHNVAAYLADPHNPLYDEARARAESYQLFVRPGLCPFDLLKYAMSRHLLSHAAFPFENGQETLQRHWDFVARYYLGEYYEGD